MKKFYVIVFVIFFVVLIGTINVVIDYNNNDKIVFYDVPNFTTFSESEDLVKEYVKSTDPNEINFIIKGKSNFEYDMGPIKMDISMEEADKIKLDRIKAGAEYFNKFNTLFYNLLPKFDFKSIYISKYFGVIYVISETNEILNSNMQLLKSIANIDLVENIFVYTDKQEAQEYISGAENSINMTEEIKRINDGDGVRVGLLDDGIVDTSVSFFNDSNITCRDHWLYTESIGEHATKMAAFITGELGMASKIDLYSVELFSNFTGELDWLIDQNVDIINMSFGFNSNPGTYDVNSAIVDELIWNYGITCCIAAGNADSDNNYYITNPALAYNAITVGAGNKKNNIYNLECYEEHTNVDKPTIVSHTDIMCLAELGATAGTSGATAMTTGVIAGLMSKSPTLKLKPALVTALITCSSYNIPNVISYLDSNLTDYFGAGFLDAEKMDESTINMRYQTTNSSQGDMSFVFEYEEFFLKGENIRISACWLAKSSGTVNSLQMTDYDLCFFRPEGGQIDCTMSSYNNVEMLNITIPATGTYTIRVIQSGDLAHTSPTDICVAWTYDTENAQA